MNKESKPGPVMRAANSPIKMGDWSTVKPILKGKCSACGLCWIFCPDAAISLDEANRTVRFNFAECKGCGICVKECPLKSIEMAEPDRKETNVH